LAVAGRMAATVAHEINNPLEALANILYLLEHNRSIDADGREFVRTAEDELRRVTQITRLTLGFHREKTGNPEPVNIPEMLDGVITLYGRRIENLNIKVRREYETEAVVTARAGEIRQIFSNLIVNAVDALGVKGDTLLIRVRDSRDWRDLSMRGVRILIADNGPGIPAKIMPHLFEPFFTTKGEKGTGIGLWVSQGIAEGHGGEIRVTSRTSGRHAGTTFSMFLPLQPESGDDSES